MDPKQTEQWYEKLFRIINSSACFCIAYIMYTYVSWLAMAFTARLYKFDAFIYYYGIKFILNNHSWDKGKVLMVYASAPLACLVLALLFFIIYNRLKKVKTVLNLFLVWAFIVGTAMFVAQGIIASLGAYQYATPYYFGSFAVIFSWWHLPNWAINVINIPLGLLFIYFAINYSKPFLVFAYSFAKVNKLARRRKYFFETAIVPFAISAFAIGLGSQMVFPPVNMEILSTYMLVIGAGLFIAWYSLAFVEIMKFEVGRYVELQNLNVFAMLFLVAICAFVYFTGRGIYLS